MSKIPAPALQEFMYGICERAAAELGKQFTASSLSSRKLMGFDGVTT